MTSFSFLAGLVSLTVLFTMHLLNLKQREINNEAN
jgi:hypothetical protein